MTYLKQSMIITTEIRRTPFNFYAIHSIMLLDGQLTRLLRKKALQMKTKLYFESV